MDILALSLLVLRIFNNTTTTTRQHNKHTKSGCGWLQGITVLFDIDLRHSDWLIVLSINLSLCTYEYEYLKLRVYALKIWEHKIRLMEMIYNTNTLPVFRHTQPKSMETEADD